MYHRLGLPVAGADEDAAALCARLVHEAGFDPVVVGALNRARAFDTDRPAVFNTGKTAREVAEALGIETADWS